MIEKNLTEIKPSDNRCLKFLKGNGDGLKDPSTVLVSSSLAESMFNNEDRVNQIIRLDNNLQMKIGGLRALSQVGG